MINTYSLSKDGNTSLSPHFKVKEFKRYDDVVEIDTELIERLEMLSDCLSNAPIVINTTHDAFSVNLYVKGHTAQEITVLSEICDFKGISVLNGSTVFVSINEYGEKPNFIKTCGWIKIVKYKKRLIDSITFPEIRDTIKNYAKRFNDKGTHVSSGGFMCTYKFPQFNYKTNGHFIRTYPDHKYGIGVTRGGEIKYGNVDYVDYTEFLSGHPVLLDDYKQCNMSYAKEVDGNHPRHAIGYEDTHYYDILIDGRRKTAPGLNLFALRQLMTHLNLSHAINLDGGGTTAGAKNGDMINNPTENRLTNNAIVIKYLGESEVN